MYAQPIALLHQVQSIIFYNLNKIYLVPIIIIIIYLRTLKKGVYHEAIVYSVIYFVRCLNIKVAMTIMLI